MAQSPEFASAKKNDHQIISPVVQQQPLQVAYETPKPPGLRMRNTGRTLTIIGSVLFVGGIAVYSSADEGYYSYQSTNYGDEESGDPKAALGIVMITGGLGMTIPGIILWSKGAKKYNAYLREQSASVKFNGRGLSLKYTF